MIALSFQIYAYFRVIRCVYYVTQITAQWIMLCASAKGIFLPATEESAVLTVTRTIRPRSTVCCPQARRTEPSITTKPAEETKPAMVWRAVHSWHFKQLQREASFQRGMIWVILGQLVFVVLYFKAPPSITCTEECLLKTGGKAKPLYLNLINSVN